MNPLFRIDFSISDSLKTVRKNVLIYETIILFIPGSNRAKYCPECAGRMKRIKAAQRKRKQRAKCHALGAKNPL